MDSPHSCQRSKPLFLILALPCLKPFSASNGLKLNFSPFKASQKPFLSALHTLWPPSHPFSLIANCFSSSLFPLSISLSWFIQSSFGITSTQILYVSLFCLSFKTQLRYCCFQNINLMSLFSTLPTPFHKQPSSSPIPLYTYLPLHLTPLCCNYFYIFYLPHLGCGVRAVFLDIRFCFILVSIRILTRALSWHHPIEPHT